MTVRRQKRVGIAFPIGRERDGSGRIEPVPCGSAVLFRRDDGDRQIAEFDRLGTFRIETERVRLAGRYAEVR